MYWYNVYLNSNRRWDIEMKRLALKTPKPKRTRSTMQNGKREPGISWIRKNRRPKIR